VPIAVASGLIAIGTTDARVALWDLGSAAGVVIPTPGRTGAPGLVEVSAGLYVLAYGAGSRIVLRSIECTGPSSTCGALSASLEIETGAVSIPRVELERSGDVVVLVAYEALAGGMGGQLALRAVRSDLSRVYHSTPTPSAAGDALPIEAFPGGSTRLVTDVHLDLATPRGRHALRGRLDALVEPGGRHRRSAPPVHRQHLPVGRVDRGRSRGGASVSSRPWHVHSYSGWATRRGRFGITKVDREKLYGKKERVIVDELNRPCSPAWLTADGSALVPGGGTAHVWMDEKWNAFETEQRRAVDEEKKPLPEIPSTLDVPQAATRVSAERLLEHVTQTVYELDVEALGPEMKSELAKGAIFEASFVYRGGHEEGRVFVLENEAGIFALLGKPTGFAMVSREILPEAPSDGDDELEGDLDFSML
jgi:hypothetical protein